MAFERNPRLSFLDSDIAAMMAVQEVAEAKAVRIIRIKLRTLERLVPGRTFNFGQGMGSRSVSMFPPLFKNEFDDSFIDDRDADNLEYQCDVLDEEGIEYPPNMRKIGPLINSILEIADHLENELHGQVGDVTTK